MSQYLLLYLTILNRWIGDISETIANLDCCTHIFCVNCIKDWTNVTNQCPLCKKRIKKMITKSMDGTKLSETRVKHKEQVPEEEPAYEIIEGIQSLKIS